MNHTLRFGSVCSGIEAASVAWAPLGWSAAWLAEIEPFPSAVLAHHYPDTPNLGDMTTIARRVLTGEVEAPEVFTGGTPCQAFSVAGLRKSLDDARGNLSLKFVELADAIDHVRGRAGEPPCIVIWENVPGVLSTKDNAFGCFLAGLAGEDEPLQPPGKRWENAGAVFGPKRAIAWRTLDAQYFGLAQRRRRVFVVASARDGFDPAQVLFEWDGVRRDSAPSRGEGKDAAGRAVAGTLRSRHNFNTTEDALGTLQPVAGTLSANGKVAGSATQQDAEAGLLVAAFGGNYTGGPREIASALSALSAHGGTGRHDFESETFITHSLRGEGFDASEDGTGRGTPLVPAFLHLNKGRPDGRQSAHTPMVTVEHGAVPTLTTDGHAQSAVAYPVPFDTTQITSASNYSNPKADDPCHQLVAGGHAPAIAFSSKDHGADATADLAPTLRAMGHAGSHANGGGQMAVAFGWQNAAAQGMPVDTISPTLDKSKHPGAMQGAAVRRLMPVECERLQGFPDDYTLIPWRKRPAEECPDGPRYKALGNSWAVPVARWVGARITQHLENA